jgi:hypothetical protein
MSKIKIAQNPAIKILEKTTINPVKRLVKIWVFLIKITPAQTKVLE